MNIQKAALKDLDNLFSITQNCGKHMIENGIFQWDKNYPTKEVLKKDIELQQIWKLGTKNNITGIIVLTEIEDSEYKLINWSTTSNNNLYIHRLAIDPIYQGKGHAQKLMDFAEDYAVKNKYTSIRLDTFSQNKRNQRFYEKRNYVKLDSIYLPNQSEHPFYCYEKVLNV